MFAINVIVLLVVVVATVIVTSRWTERLVNERHNLDQRFDVVHSRIDDCSTENQENITKLEDSLLRHIEEVERNLNTRINNCSFENQENITKLEDILVATPIERLRKRVKQNSTPNE